MALIGVDSSLILSENDDVLVELVLDDVCDDDAQRENPEADAKSQGDLFAHLEPLVRVDALLRVDDSKQEQEMEDESLENGSRHLEQYLRFL